MKNNQLKRQGKRARKKRKTLVIVGIVVVILILLVVVGSVVIRALGKASIRSQAAQDTAQLTSQEDVTSEEESEGIIYYQGKRYQYNQDIVTLLCMGIDSEANTQEYNELGRSGQADANFLLVLDERNQKMKLIGIPRDTMTQIDIYDYYGTFFSTATAQLGLQYAYGDGKQLSCESMVKAVSNLMYGLPIHGYVSINMDAVPILNDAVGGVEVTIPDDSDFCEQTGYEPGEHVTLWGDDALEFIRSRNMTTFASNNLRMQRQKQYLTSFAQAAKSATKADLTVPITLFQEISSYMYTNVTIDQVTYLATMALDLEFSQDDLSILTGEVKQGQVFEEYYVDEEELYELILEVFYEELK